MKQQNVQVRIHKGVTKIQTKRWLERLANDEDQPTAEFISTLYQTVIEHHYSVQSTASMLRATCLIEAWNNK